MKKGKKIIIFISTLILVAIIYSLFVRKKEEKLYVNEYKITKLEKTDVLGTLSLNGKISANNPIGIFVDKKLKVKEVFVKDGDFVEKGTVLVTFDDEDKNRILRSIEKETININKIKRNLNKLEELHKLGGASLEEIKIEKENLRISELNLEEYKETLSKTAREVKSPVSGVVSKLRAQANYLVDTDNSLLEIIDSDDLRIIVEIPEYNATLVKVGQPVKLKLEISESDEEYEGSISKISKISTTSTLTSESVLEADVKAKKAIPTLVPGFKIKATVELKTDKKTIIVPKISLQFEEGKYFIYAIDDKNIVSKKEVEIKNISGDNVIIEKGLKSEEKIIENPDIRLKNGVKLLENDTKK